MTNSAENPSSTKPYLLRALYEWCTDNGLTPYLAVHVDSQVRVPREHVKNGEIVLNISFGATTGLKIGHDDVRFKARFGGVARDILVPVSHVTAIYARENGQGMAFPMPESGAGDPAAAGSVEGEDAQTPETAPASHLHAVPDSTQAAAEIPEQASRSVDASKAEGEPPADPPPRPSGGHLKRVK
ncbi:MAG: ClpXP protease specificity-enhancing factor [Thiomonas sp.]